MNKLSLAENLSTNAAGQDIGLFDQALSENQKKKLAKDPFIKKTEMKKIAKTDGLGGTPADGSSYSGIVDGYRDNKSFVEEGYSPENPQSGFAKNFQRKMKCSHKTSKK
jgi:hypothetical protein